MARPSFSVNRRASGISVNRASGIPAGYKVLLLPLSSFGERTL